MSSSTSTPKKNNNPKTDFTLTQLHYLVGPFAVCREDRKLSKVIDLGEEVGCKIELTLCSKCRTNNKEMSYKMRYLGQSSSSSISSVKTDEMAGHSASNNMGLDKTGGDEEMKEQDEK